MPLSTRFPALASPDFRRLWPANIFSAIGGQMQMVALNWQIYELTHDALALGAIGLVRVIPILLFSLLGGSAADHYDRRKLLLMTQGSLTVIALVLGALSLSGGITPTAIYALAALSAAVTAFNNPAYQALIPSLVGRENLQNAVTLGTTGFQVATVIGPALAGIVIGRYGIAWAYLINAVTFLAPLTVLATLRYRPARTEETSPPLNFLESLREGIVFMRSTPILLSTMLLDFIATFFSSASALLPIFARDILHVGAEGFGLLSAAPAVGSSITAVTLALLPPIRETGKTLILAVLLFGFATIGFGLSTTFPAALFFLALTGATDTVSTVIRQTVRQLVTPDRMRGRMIAIGMIFFMGGPQLGELEAGVVARWFGAVASVVSGGILSVLGTLTVAANATELRRFRLAEHPRPEER
ncbi:MAG: MFS transporter [Capsulimonadales bacterium]|nr:MFS transporter [Capsulimonadales bacterium]